MSLCWRTSSPRPKLWQSSDGRKAETAAKRVDILQAHFAQVAIGIKLAIMMGDSHVASGLCLTEES
jgi:hypothetical protein